MTYGNNIVLNEAEPRKPSPMVDTIKAAGLSSPPCGAIMQKLGHIICVRCRETVIIAFFFKRTFLPPRLSASNKTNRANSPSKLEIPPTGKNLTDRFDCPEVHPPFWAGAPCVLIGDELLRLAENLPTLGVHHQKRECPKMFILLPWLRLQCASGWKVLPRAGRASEKSRDSLLLRRPRRCYIRCRAPRERRIASHS